MVLYFSRSTITFQLGCGLILSTLMVAAQPAMAAPPRLLNANLPAEETTAPQADSTAPSKQPTHKISKIKKNNEIDAEASKHDENAYDYSLPGVDGDDLPLSLYKDKYVLIVNLGRKSNYSDQLPALVKLNDSYRDKGLVVIGVPSDDFGAAEPGKDSEVQKAYADAKVDFPVAAVSKITGEGELPLYTYLTKSKGAPPGGSVHWNYTKFLIDKNGHVIVRFNPDVSPDSPEMLSTINQVLAGRYKPDTKHDKDGAKPADDGSDDDE